MKLQLLIFLLSCSLLAVDYTRIPQASLDSQRHFSQTGSLKTQIPAKMAAGQNGYLIVTNEHIRQNSKALKKFIEHKEARGFKIFLATEKDFGVGRGRKQADKVRKWMASNYKKMNLLYTLITVV